MDIQAILLEIGRTLGWRDEILLESGTYLWWQGALKARFQKMCFLTKNFSEKCAESAL